jgi:hypothetical protein
MDNLTITLIGLLITLLFFSCTSIQKSLDKSGLKDIAKEFNKNFQPGTPDKLRQFIKDFDFKKNTLPLETQNVTRSKLTNLKVIDLMGKNVITEKITFPSHINLPAKQESAVFYLFRKSKLKNNKVILWIPGKGISDFAFRFIEYFFRAELKRGYNILLYIPPYHMDRKTEKSPDTFFTSNIHDNLNLYMECIRELRTGMAFLRHQNVSNISAWGGSMGGSMLLNLTNMERFNHITIMIPVLDWKTLTYDNKVIEKIIPKYEKAGFTKQLLHDAYNLISPSNYPIGIPPGKVQILYAKHDQLTPENVTLKFSKTNKITNIISYNKSHATILLSSKIYRDYAKFLDSIK